MKLECENNRAFLLVTFSVSYKKNNCGLKLSLQNKHLGNSGIIILWEPIPVSCLLLFLVFQTKEGQPHLVFILYTFSWLPPPWLRPVFLLAAAAPTECCCRARCRAARLCGWQRWLGGSGSTVTSGRSPCLALTFLASLLYQVHLPEAPFGSNFFPCRCLQWFLGCWSKALPRPPGPGKVTPPAHVPLNLPWVGDSYPPAPTSCLKSSLSSPLNSCSRLYDPAQNT